MDPFRRRSGRSALTGWVTLLACAAVAAPAESATVEFDRKCYSPGDHMTQTGTGFTPGANVHQVLSITTPFQGTSFDAPVVTADANGNFTGRLVAPDLLNLGFFRHESARSDFSEETDPGKTLASVSWTLTDWGLRVKAWSPGDDRGRFGIGKPDGRMTVDAYGWTSAGTRLYAHYFHGGASVKNVKLGALTGDCGDLRVRVRQFPMRRVSSGKWKVIFTPHRRYRKHDAWWRYDVRVP
jgi:hypothetical protein